MVFCGLYPSDSDDYETSRPRWRKLHAQRRGLQLRTGDLAGAGLRLPPAASSVCCIWRSSRSDWNASSRWTSSPPLPRSSTKVETNDGKTLEIDNPSHLPDPTKIRTLYEPYVNMDIHVPTICGQRHEALRGKARHAEKSALSGRQPRGGDLRAALCGDRLRLFRRLKSATRGYASMDYQPIDYGPRISSSWTSCSTANRWTRWPSSCTVSAPTPTGGRWPSSSSAPSRASSSRWPSWRPSARDHRPRDGLRLP